MFQHLLVPVDGSAFSDRAAQVGLELARKLGARVTGFVAEPMPKLPSMGVNPATYGRETDAHLARSEAHAQTVLERFQTLAAEQGVPFEGKFRRVDAVDEAIVAAATEFGCDLIVMVTHGRGAFGELLFGSHTKNVMSRSTLPLLGAALNPAGSLPHVDPRLAGRFVGSGLRPLRLGGRTLLPVVQGGMGVGISARGLAGSVAALGGVGTISSVDLRRHHPDLMKRTEGLGAGEAARQAIDAANLEALGREIRAARELAQGRGLLAVNVMRAVSEYAPSVRRALECGIDAVVVGAGLPLDLPDLAQDHPQAVLVPILSDARGVQLIVKKWERKKRLPDAIVIEHPRLAGGHLGAATVADLGDPRFDFENVIPQSLAFLRSAGIEREIPLIAAGGIRSFDDIARLQALGAAAVQLGTPFAVTAEGDAHPEFKRVLAEARDDEMVEFTSVAGLPARAVATPWLQAYLRAEPRLQAVVHAKTRCTKAFDCLAQCGLRDGLAGWGQFCIDNQLAAALRGDVKKGLFFRGVGALPFGSQIRSVRDLMERLLSRSEPVPA